MQFSLSVCALAGVSLNDLQFFNSSCDLNDFVISVTDELITLGLALGECGMTQEVRSLRLAQHCIISILNNITVSF